ncbi:hypothetical protein EAI89_11770 [Eubacterium sp. am_0171]|uniref:hypothetical protein n=1 Tax=unclassified Eubacterium (in: firmicutes) TaxID=2624479 RepID=UPI0010227923|nr:MULTISPECIES: hypothetical protein [unclassified Eubacterium (in: firmicutes)]MSC84784.1 hypothetical protein [Eubacterium sp. BIOML-A1]MSD06849.1 hypothetical protein [Eubacterium sp. BIOML-A2]RYT17618.1 hypothetical protein EAI89_11770 [Eubacterium sp. am_0171]
MQNSNKRINEILLISALSIIPKLVLVFYAYPFNIIGDEIWTLASAAKIAGFDWTGILDGGRYYGMGFYSLFFPLFRMIDSPVVLYRSILFICVIMNSLISIIAYFILINFSNIKKRGLRIPMAVLASYFVILPVTYIYNEHIYVLICWCVLLLLLLLDANQDNKKKVMLYTVLLLTILTYAMLIHNRAITLWIAVVFVIILYFIAYRKWIVNWKVFSIMGIIVYILINIFIEHQVEWLWITSSENLGNTAVYNGGLLNILKPEYWQAWISIILGQLFTGDVFTGGLLIFLFIIAVVFIYKVFCKSEKTEKDTIMFIVFVFTLVCVAITIGGQSVNWLQGVKEAMERRSSNADAYRGVTYLRYYMSYVGPMLLLGSIYLKEKWHENKKYVPYIIWAKVLLCVVWFAFIFPYIISAVTAASSFRPFSFQSIFDITSGMRTYFPAVVVSIILFVYVIIVLHYKKSYQSIIFLFSLFFIYKYIYTGITVLNIEKDNYQSINGFAKVVDEHKDICNNIKEIYVQGDRALKEELQFLLKESLIKTDINYADEFILFSQFLDNTNAIGDLDIYYGQIDENEYIYVKGKENLDIIENLGIEVMQLHE